MHIPAPGHIRHMCCASAVFLQRRVHASHRPRPTSHLCTRIRGTVVSKAVTRASRYTYIA